MCRASWKCLIITFFSFLSWLNVQGQNTDCVTAQIICSDERITFTPKGPGMDDFANRNNKPGCLLGGFDGYETENQSAWYYFEFREDMPPNSVIEFTISPFLRPGVNNPDFDFAIFGPDLKCDSLGFPVRCSFATKTCDFCPETGLGRGATDNSEPADSSDGFVAPMVVQPGEGYYLVLDNFLGDATGFTMTWGGSAAPFLNCLANPICNNKTVDAGDDMQFCQNPAPFKLNASAKNVSSRVKYEWLGTPQALSFLNNKNILQPTVTIPAGFSGVLDYILSITDGDCVTADAIVVNITPSPDIQLQADTVICSGDSTVISLTNTFQSYRWSTGANTPTITVTNGGTYSVTVSAGPNCNLTDQITIVRRESPKPIVTGGGKLCNGNLLTLKTDKTYAAYAWSNGSSADTITVNAGGNYSVTVTDVDGCQGTGAQIVTEFPKPTPQITGTTAFCEGQTTTLSTSQAFMSYRWSSGETVQTITKDTAGQFFVTVTDANGCQGSDEIILTRNPLPTLAVEGSRVFCENSMTELKAVTNAPQTNWSTGATTSSIIVNREGMYSVTVRNAAGCSKTEQVTITMKASPKPIVTGGGKLCSGNLLTLKTDKTYAAYAWSNGSSGDTITVNAGGNYSVTVTDVDGCQGTGAQIVTEFPKPTPQITGTTAFCEGQTTTLSTSQAFMSYRWSSGETVQTITKDTAGQFFVTVTDANGCQGSDEIILTRNPLPTLAVEGSRVFCENSMTELKAVTNAAQIRWSTGANTAQIPIASGGNYSVTVSNADGCQRVETINIQQQARPQPFIDNTVTICPENSATLQAQGTFEKYRWSTGDTTATIQVRQPGSYTLEVTDVFGCTGNATQTVAVFPTVPVPNIRGARNFCPDLGTALIIDGNYQNVSWSNGATGDSIQVFQSGTYVVTVMDANGCISKDSAQVEPFVVTKPTSDTLYFCTGDQANLNPGNTYVNYRWSNSSTSPTISVSDAGIYSVTVTDGNGCTADATYSVLENSAPQISIKGEPRFCKDGTTQLVAPPGFSSYRWSTNDTTTNIIVQTPNDYRLTITDTNGCTAVSSIRVTELPLPIPEIQGPNSLCGGERATLSLSTPFREYRWSDQSQLPSLNISQGGLYAVTVTDDNGCQGTTTKQINAFSNPTVQIAADSILCEGTVSTLAATPGFASYQWSNGGAQDTIRTGTPGKYSVIVTDANGCIGTDTVNIVLINIPSANAGQNKILNCDTRSVQLGTPFTGQGNYRFNWQGPGITASNANALQPIVSVAGTYTFWVVDTLNNCRSTEATTQVVDQSYTPSISLQLQDTLDCNTARVTISAAGSHQGNNITYQWYNARKEALANERGVSLNTSQEGVYYFQVNDPSTGCTALDSIEVMADFDPAFVEAGPAQTLNCIIDTVTLTGSTSSDANHILYQWIAPNGRLLDNQITTQANQPGWYNLIVTNSKNGCSNRDSVEVLLDRTPPTVNAGADQTLHCNISAVMLQGTVLVNDSNTIYTWKSDNDFSFTNANQLSQTVDKAGLYMLEAKNLQNGCMAADSVVVVDESNYPTELKLKTTDPSCFGAKNGRIQIQQVTGGMGPYLFSLNGAPLESVEQFENLAAGKYLLRVEDVAGCAYETAVTLEEGTLLQVDLGKDTTIRFGARITLEAFVNVPTQTITALKWEGNIVENCFDGCWLQPVAAKEIGQSTYSITVTNEAGCVAQDAINVIVENSRGVYIPEAFSPNGDGYNDVFMVYAGTEAVTVKKLLIMSRWGNMVFQGHNFRPNDPARGWNGRLPDGNAFNPGVFVYLAEVEFIDGTTLQYYGDVTLVK